MTAPEIRWIENDMKVDKLRSDMLKLKKEFQDKNGGNNLCNYDEKLKKYIDKIVKSQFKELLTEQFSIINSSLQTDENKKYLY